MKKTYLFSAFLGTIIEVYDFTVFSFVIPILSEVFFPDHLKNSAINFTILAFIIGYIVKPIGAIGFGYLIDCYGRKRVLLITTTSMTLATMAIGLLPSWLMGKYYGAGLLICRVIQGLSISGEFLSAIIIIVEQGRKNTAFLGSLAFVGGSLGLLFANMSVFLLLYRLPHELIIQYAWRIPFLIGSVGCFILLMVRNKITDDSSLKIAIPSGFKELVAKHRNKLIETFLVSSLSASSFYLSFVFMPTYLSTVLNLHSHKQSTLIIFITLLIYLIFLPCGGILADMIGIKRQIKIAAVCYLLFSYYIFSLIPQLDYISCIEVLCFFSIIQALLNSALPAFIVNQFQPDHRGKALSISYNIALTIFAGLMPYLTISLGKNFNLGIPISLCAVFSLLALNFKGVKYDNLRSKPSYR